MERDGGPLRLNEWIELFSPTIAKFKNLDLCCLSNWRAHTSHHSSKKCSRCERSIRHTPVQTPARRHPHQRTWGHVRLRPFWFSTHHARSSPRDHFDAVRDPSLERGSGGQYERIVSPPLSPFFSLGFPQRAIGELNRRQHPSILIALGSFLRSVSLEHVAASNAGGTLEDSGFK